MVSVRLPASNALLGSIASLRGLRSGKGGSEDVRDTGDGTPRTPFCKYKYGEATSELCQGGQQHYQ